VHGERLGYVFAVQKVYRVAASLRLSVPRTHTIVQTFESEGGVSSLKGRLVASSGGLRARRVTTPGTLSSQVTDENVVFLDCSSTATDV